MNKVFRLDRRSVLKIFLLTAVFFFAAHLYRFLSLGFAHDSLVLNQSGDDFWQLSLGRFMQVFYHRIRGNIPVPYIVGLLSYLYLAGSVCLLADLLSLSSTLSISLVSMVMCSNVTLTFASATFLPWLDAYMLALFFAVLCVFCAVRLPKAGWVLAPLSLLVSLGLYPSYSEIAAILCLIVLIGDALDGAFLPSPLSACAQAAFDIDRRLHSVRRFAEAAFYLHRLSARRLLQQRRQNEQSGACFSSRPDSRRIRFPAQMALPSQNRFFKAGCPVLSSAQPFLLYSRCASVLCPARLSRMRSAAARLSAVDSTGG